MSTRTPLILAGLLGLTTLGTAASLAADKPAHALPASKSGDLVVGLCDGETSMEVPGVKPGQTLDRKDAQAVSDALMKSWREKNPHTAWDGKRVAMAAPPDAGKSMADRVKNTAAGKPFYKQAHGAPDGGPGGAKPTGAGSAGSADTYSSYTERDGEIWKASTQNFIDKGDGVFHDAKQLGGTVGISCDMCHPNAANTHPETYPKFQVQLGRVALLRDMINWCIENPVRGKPLADDDERMRALEAYIISQRKGVALEYGKH